MKVAEEQEPLKHMEEKNPKKKEEDSGAAAVSYGRKGECSVVFHIQLLNDMLETNYKDILLSPYTVSSLSLFIKLC